MMPAMSLRLVPLAVAALFVACEPELTPVKRDGTNTVVAVASVTVVASTSRCRVGDQVALTATALDEKGAPIADAPLRFGSTDEYVLAVDEQGVARALQQGAVKVFAVSGDIVSEQVDVEVVPNASAGQFSVRMADGRLTLPRGAVRTVPVTVRDGSGNQRPEVVLVWRLESGTAVSLLDAGIVRAEAAGSAELSARTPQGAEGRLVVDVVEGSTALEVRWSTGLASVASERSFPILANVLRSDLLSQTGAGVPVTPDALTVFDGTTSLGDVTTLGDGGLAPLDVSRFADGTVLRLSLRATVAGQTAQSATRDVHIRRSTDAGTGWTSVGAQVDDDAWEHVMALDSLGRPWVAYRRENDAIRVMRFEPDGGRWLNAGRNVLAPEAPTRAELIAMDAGRLPDAGYLPFRQDADPLNQHTFSIQYNYWPRQPAANPTIAFDPQGRAVVAFGEGQPSPGGLGSELSHFWDVRVKRLPAPGGVWEFLGGNVEGVRTDDCRDPRIAFEPDSGVPVVATACVDRLTGLTGVDVMVWRDPSWQRFGSALPRAAVQREVRSLVFESADDVRLTLDEEGVSKTWRLRRSGQWVELSGNGVQQATASGSSVVGTSTTNDDATVLLSTSQGWARLGDVLDEKPWATAIQPIVAVGGGARVVAWREGDPRINLDVHVSRYDDTALEWQPIGARLDTIDAPAISHCVAVSSTGTVFVSWSEVRPNGVPRLRVLRR